MNLRRGVGTLLWALLILSIPGQIVATSHSASGTIPVSATAPPRPDVFSLSVSPTQTSTFSAGSSTTYTLTYGSTRTYATEPFTIELEWSRATVSGSTTQLDLLDYQTGSATAAFGGTPAVFDPVNRKVRWTVPSLPPATTNQSVSLTLKAKTDTSTAASTGTVRMRLIVPNVTLTDTIRAYEVQPTPASTATTSPSPSTSTSESPSTSSTEVTTEQSTESTASPSPTTPLTIDSLAVTEVTASTATLEADTSQPTTAVLSYGTSLSALQQSLTHATLQSTHQFQLTGLLPETTYYVQLVIKNASGETVSSDFILVRTAAASTPPTLTLPILRISSDGVVLSDGSLETDPTIVIPTDTSYEFTVALASDGSIASAQAIIDQEAVVASQPLAWLPPRQSTPPPPALRRLSLLAALPSTWSLIPRAQAASPTDRILTQASLPDVYVTDLIATRPVGTFTGRLQSPAKPGLYPLHFRLADTKGNLVTLPGFKVRVVPQFVVVHATTDEPIEKARVHLLRQNETSRLYEDIPSHTFGWPNPIHTRTDGTAPVTLPKGDYQFEVSAVAFDTQVGTFTLGAQPGDDLPRIALEPGPVNPWTIGQYYWHVVADVVDTTSTYLRALSTSNRLFDLVGLLVLATTVALTLVAFRSRTHVPIRRLPQYFLSLIQHTWLHRHQHGVLHGRIQDASASPVSRAVVHFVDPKTNQIQHETQTDRLGNFFAPLTVESCTILVTRQGYMPQTVPVDWDAPATRRELTITLEAAKQSPSVVTESLAVGELLVGMGFELFLAISLLLEVLFTLAFGWPRTWLFLFVSLGNLTIWVLFRLAEYRSRLTSRAR